MKIKDKELMEMITTFLIYTGLFMLVSAIILAFKIDSDIWFSRLILGVICLGFTGVLKAIKNINNGN